MKNRIVKISISLWVGLALVVLGAGCTQGQVFVGNWSAPAFDGEYVYATGGGVLSRLQEDNLSWDTSFNPSIVIGASYGDLVSDGDKLYAAGHVCEQSNCTSIVVSILTTDNTYQSINITGKVLGEMAVVDDVLLVPLSVTDNKERPFGLVNTYNASDLTPLGSLRFDDEIVSGLSLQNIDGDKVAFFGTAKGTVYAVDVNDPGNMQIKWQVELGSTVMARPVYSDGTLYVGTLDGENNFQALDASSGTNKWSFTTEAWLWAPPVLSSTKEVVYLTDFDGTVSALRTSNGQAVWGSNADLNTTVVASPAVVMRGEREYLAVPSYLGNVHLVSAADGANSAQDFFDTSFGVASAPLAAGNNIHVLNTQGELLTFSVSTLSRLGCLDIASETLRCRN